MDAWYEKYKALKLDGCPIGLAEEDSEPYFCTPVDAEIIGWDNGIHYCFLPEFGEMVFCVNPETRCDQFVYPIAENFRDFLRLILAVGCTNPLQQIVWWGRKQFEDFIRNPEEAAYAASPEVTAVLRAIGEHLDLTPMEDPFGYVKGLQTDFPYERIPFSNEYYDTLGLERPDGTEPEENGFAFEAAVFTFPSEP